MDDLLTILLWPLRVLTLAWRVLVNAVKVVPLAGQLLWQAWGIKRAKKARARRRGR